jgi:hypothetical protein
MNNAGKMAVPFQSGQIIAIFLIIAHAIRHSGWVLSVGYVLLFFQINVFFKHSKTRANECTKIILFRSKSTASTRTPVNLRS